MKLPRWLVVSLIVVSAVALVAVPAWLWIDMPQRTGAKFVEAIEAKEIDRLNELLADTTCTLETWSELPPSTYVQLDLGSHYSLLRVNLVRLQVIAVPRGLRELLLGHQKMAVQTTDGHDSGVTFCASWNKVTTEFDGHSGSLGRMLDANLKLRQQQLQRVGSQSAQ